MKKAICKHLFTSVVLSGALLTALPAVAQDVPPLAESVVFSYDIADGPAFMAAIKEHTAFRMENGDPRSWQVYTPTLGDDLQRVVIRGCCYEWKDMDSYDAWSQENPAFMQNWRETAGPFMKSYGHEFHVIDWDNSHWGADDGPFRFVAVTTYHIKPSHVTQFEEARRTVSQIALDQGWANDDRVWLWSSSVGGGTEYSLVIPHANYADMDLDDSAFAAFLTGKLGEDRAREVMSNFMSSIEKTEFQLWEHHPDLSMNMED